ncbi:SDR family NAD(P)-dependent oxidoreductase [Nonomuraea dietziae]|uniref:NAD(P)-dependent dehydrogenase (Short-subunit alcohol dehydrogenase family) n=1 Tax=Nonomuraea dietziae TaxID=65515 RepID=A0A7W5YD70_9ACTN|nr:SDR family NAD(P)-dependent oxidoreductase [Nonomuraea dietziae]MBB3733938.1 NAD(P)-dependent dehydrogenase (short-subunit alcohol dehydrogenase family) [Nonomuraea dietziae]
MITGGTDGIGAALARALFSRGDRAVMIGTDPAKGERLESEADSALGKAVFVQADLSLVSNTRRTIDKLAEEYPAIDGVVLCARFMRSYRSMTAEGLEDNFALFYLSRLLFSYGLLGPLEKTDRPVIVNVAGPGHDTPVAWDDLQSARRYDLVHAMFMTGRLNDLLGVTFAERHDGGPVRYVLFHPGTTATSYAGELDPQTEAYLRQQKMMAKPPTEVVPPLLRLLDDPPKPPLTAFNLFTELNVHTKLFSATDAERLSRVTDELLARVTR